MPQAVLGSGQAVCIQLGSLEPAAAALVKVRPKLPASTGGGAPVGSVTEPPETLAWVNPTPLAQNLASVWSIIRSEGEPSFVIAVWDLETFSTYSVELGKCSAAQATGLLWVEGVTYDLDQLIGSSHGTPKPLLELA